MSTLFSAHNQWKNRPDDERYENIRDMHTDAVAFKEAAREIEVPFEDLRIEADNGEIRLAGRKGNGARLSWWAFAQICRLVGFPVEVLRNEDKLGDRPTLVAQNLNCLLAKRPPVDSEDGRKAKNAQILLHKNGDWLVRAITTEKYGRIWNADLTERLVRLVEANPAWHNPMAYAKGGVFSGEMKPSGLYLSDHDMFAFMVDNDHPIIDPLTGNKLNRGFFVENDEVGGGCLAVTTFLYDWHCGNHIIHGVTGLAELRLKHMGDVNTRVWKQVEESFRKHLTSGAGKTQQLIAAAQHHVLAPVMNEVQDALLTLARKVKAPEIGVRFAQKVVEMMPQREDRYGDPRSMWSAVNCITELSQGPFADDRTKLDRAAGKLLSVVDV